VPRRSLGVLEGVLEVRAVLDEVGAESAHGGILFSAVAVRHYERRLDAMPPRGESNALAVIAASRGDDGLDFGMLTSQVVEVNESAADFEGADGGVVFVFHPHFRAQALAQ